MNDYSSSTSQIEGETVELNPEAVQISFIVPVYNVEPYIRECVLSILELKQISFEIILIDDGSVDRSMEVIADLWKDNPAIITVSQKNSGQSVARNKGMELAKGDYIFFVDSDDKIIASALQEIFLERNKEEDIIIGDFYKWGGEGTALQQEPSLSDHSIRLTGKQILQHYFLKSFEMVIGRNIYKSSFIKKHNLSFLEGVYFEDAEWTSRCFALAQQILYVNKALYVYRNQRDGSTMNSPFSVRKYNDLFTVSQAINHFTKDIKDKEVSGIVTKFAGNLALTALKRARLTGLSVDPEPILKFYKSLKLPASINKGMQYLLFFSRKIFFKVLSKRSF